MPQGARTQLDSATATTSVKYPKILFIAGVLLLCTNNYAAEIRWYQNHAPPIYISHGENSGKGIADRIIEFFAQELPQHQMTYVAMNTKRFWHEMELGNNYCRADSIKTIGRQQRAAFTMPIYFSAPARIAMHQQDWQALGMPASLSLTDLLRNINYKGAAIIGASFGKVVDSLLKNSETTHFERKVSESHSMLDMVNARRVNYTLGFPIYIRAYLTKNPSHSIRLIKIQEEVNYYPVYVVCTKNSWGKAMVKDLNVVLDKHRFSEKFLDNLRVNGQLSDEDILREHFEEISNLK